VEWCGVARRLSWEEKKHRLPGTDNVTVTHRTTAACTARGGDVAASDPQLARSVNSASVSSSGGSVMGWGGRNCDPTGIVVMGRAQFTAKLFF
jgi:hypothetical protein